MVLYKEKKEEEEEERKNKEREREKREGMKEGSRGTHGMYWKIKQV